MEAPYVPPMSLQGNFAKASAAPLMLTDGSSAPGAASAKARALTSGKIGPKQAAGGHMEVRLDAICALAKFHIYCQLMPLSLSC